MDVPVAPLSQANDENLPGADHQSATGQGEPAHALPDARGETPPRTVWAVLGLLCGVFVAYTEIFRIIYDKSDTLEETFTNPVYWKLAAVLLACSTFWSIAVRNRRSRVELWLIAALVVDFRSIGIRL